MKAVLAIGGTDSSCGAGLARDLAVIAAQGLEARLCVTAVTAQGAGGVTASHPLPAKIIAAQIAAAGPVAAIKTGMLANESVIAALRDLPPVPMVIDPVLAATSGARLLDAAGVAALRKLFARATLLTPNRPEAQALTGETAPDAQAAALMRQGAKAVLIKGGHADGTDATDLLFSATGCRSFSAPRLPDTRRGTGCTLATAIACGLAQGGGLEQAVAAAKAYLTGWWQS